MRGCLRRHHSLNLNPRRLAGAALGLLLLAPACASPADLPVDDADGDGVRLPYDCDDQDPSISPDALERCDGIDNDCDFETDEDPTDGFYWYIDDDGDGYGLDAYARLACLPREGEVGTPGDCEDQDEDISPGQDEECDGEDNDCDGEIDENAARDAKNWYPDQDGDGYGASVQALHACEAPEGYVSGRSDCDDTRADVNPDERELCDGVDQNCDGDIDEGATDQTTWYFDFDEDGYGNPNTAVESCEAPDRWVSNGWDCMDGDPTSFPGAPERCDSDDNDCDGQTDEEAADASTWYPDVDEDGFGDGESSYLKVSCNTPSGYTDDDADCDDGDATISPLGVEICSSEVDEDCDGELDACQSRTLLQGGAEDDLAGFAVSAVGDQDGDGLAELAIGAYGAGRGNAGEVYVLLGPASAELGPDEVWARWTGAKGDGAGYALAGGADLDGDGLGDLVVGGPDSDRGGEDAGAAWVLYGTAGGGSLDEGGAVFAGDTAGMGLGAALSAGGDLDGDGLGELAIGAPEHDGAGTDAGAVLLFGAAPTGSYTSADADAWLSGEAANDQAGEALLSGADLDGDGLPDLVIGASRAEYGGSSKAGRVYLVTGLPAGSLSLADADVTLGGPSTSARAGRALAAPGDLDGDGYDDLIVGAPYADGEESESGVVYALAGPLGSGALADLAFATWEGPTADGRAGWSLATGDLDGDGFTDLAIGAPYDTIRGVESGTVWLTMGPFSGAWPLSVADARVQSTSTAAQTGRAIAILGDTDGDGREDLLVGAPKDSGFADKAGVVLLVPGF